MNIADIIASVTITAIPAAVLIIIGVSQRRSIEPVGFWSGTKPPSRENVTDVAVYNKKHGMMWILYGAGMEPAMFISMLLLKITDRTYGVIPIMIEVFGGLFLMIRYHNYLDRKYVKRQIGMP